VAAGKALETGRKFRIAAAEISILKFTKKYLVYVLS